MQWKEHYDEDSHIVCGTGIHYFKKIECAFYFTLNIKSYTGHYTKWHGNCQNYFECDFMIGKWMVIKLEE